ncbi:MAG: hypothetical protein OEU32_05075 [Acidimicrobiia bacterium]|nr:hypothetical protein [Acidimicrobiia bacterium]
MTRLVFSDDIGKRTRTGDWADQVISTVTKIEELLAAGTAEEAADLIDYFMEEAEVCHNVYATWHPGFLEWLGQAGIESGDLDDQIARITGLLVRPDGRSFDPFSCWAELRAEADDLTDAVRNGALVGADAVRAVDDLREQWRQMHDRWVDLLSGLLALAADRFGEDALEPMYRHTLEPYIQDRYMVYDLSVNDYADTLYRNLYTSIEAMRGHLVGPERRGDIDLEEHDDRWVLSFDPCGSGGRSTRGDPVEGTGPRPEPPYSFGVTEKEHDWAWNEKGVCHYCAHCCFTLERLPAERWGHPVRVVDSPLYPDETSGDDPKPCTWTIYKTIEAIPAEAYVRIGMTKPPAA